MKIEDAIKAINDLDAPAQIQKLAQESEYRIILSDLVERGKVLEIIDQVKCDDEYRKQIAKKPIEGATFKHIGKCPDCNQIISTRSASNNCQYCGQKIDWGKDE